MATADEHPEKSESANDDLPRLELNPDNVCQLIQLARDFHAQDAVLLPDELEDEETDDASELLSDYTGDPILEEFRSIIGDLERRQQVRVVALLWLGRGDFDLEEWGRALTEADQAWTAHTADYLLAHPMLADQLAEGLEMFGYSCD